MVKASKDGRGSVGVCVEMKLFETVMKDEK